MIHWKDPILGQTIEHNPYPVDNLMSIHHLDTILEPFIFTS